MHWLVLTYSLPSKTVSSPRVAIWRRLQRWGAISPTGSVYILPTRDECLEAFQWLAQEIRQAEGEALVLHVEQFEGMRDSEMIQRFQAARAEEYAEVEAQLAELEVVSETAQAIEVATWQANLGRLKRRHADIARVDYFDSPDGRRVAARLARLQSRLVQATTTQPTAASRTLANYRSRRWVTRPSPHVDRLACVWLIRRFIDPAASIRYSLDPQPDEVMFDMPNASLGHQGNWCTFETMLQVFGLDDAGLRSLAEIVHELDLRDGLYSRPETVGVDAVLMGWLAAGLTDNELEAYGLPLFEGLYRTLEA